jgi:hypothetical protein
MPGSVSTFDMTVTKSDSLDWALWFYWIMATTVGWLAGSLFSSAIPIAVSGVAITVFQGLVLYKRIRKVWRWVVFSSLGWIAGYIFSVIFLPEELGILIGPLLGAILGVIQWLLLRREFEWAGWWIPISIIAWTTGLTLLPGALTSGALPGALTGLALVILFRFAAKETTDQPVAKISIQDSE